MKLLFKIPLLIFATLFFTNISFATGYTFDFTLSGNNCDNPTTILEDESTVLSFQISYTPDSGTPPNPQGSWYRLHYDFVSNAGGSAGIYSTNWVPWGSNSNQNLTPQLHFSR